VFDEVLDLVPGGRRQIAGWRSGIGGQGELRPDYEVGYAGFQTVRPVIWEDLVEV
jgi:hypothetical protein